MIMKPFKAEITQPENTLIKVTGPYSQNAGIIGRIGRILWAPIAYILGINFKL